jgi:hypothetical protein
MTNDAGTIGLNTDAEAYIDQYIGYYQQNDRLEMHDYIYQIRNVYIE